MASKEKVKMQQITIMLKVDDLNRLREYADKKGVNPVSHYIREGVLSIWKTMNKINILLHNIPI